MITTSSMRQLFAALLESDRDAVTRALLSVGLVHFLDIRELPGEWISSLKEHHPEGETEKVGELRRRLENFFRSSQIEVSHFSRISEAVEDATRRGLSVDDAEAKIEEIATRIRRIRDEQKEAQDEILKLEEVRRRIPSHGIDKQMLEGEHRYIRVRFGTVPDSLRDEFEAALGRYSAVFIPGDENEAERIDFLLSLRRDEERIAKLLERYDWMEKTGEGDGSAFGEMDSLSLSKIDEKIETHRKRQADLEKKAARVVEERKEELGRLWTTLRIRELSGRIERFYRKTDRTYLVSGWVPEKRREEVTEAIVSACGGRCRIEWHDPTDAKDSEVSKKAPVKMENPKLLRPFQKLVENYAIPAYGTLDPTPFVAIFYLSMFGLMFGDAGHGAVLVLIGFLGSRAAAAKGKETMLFPLLVWCGAAAMVAGALFGSYFGLALFPPIWFDYHGVVMGHGGTGSVRTLTDILVITIYFGITVISVGLLLNWINRIRTKDWFKLVWEPGGLIVGWIYAAGTYCGFYFVRHEYRQLPETGLLMPLIGLPVLLLALKPYLAHRRRRFDGETSGGIIDMVMEWIVGVLEIFSGYLSNTLSFMRVAGLGIAHVSLMAAFFQIADMAAQNGGSYGFWSYLILLLGNVLVIGLEGLSAGIQSLRLNYYEFFSKYFSGTGRAYAPISLTQNMKE
jgi:V/A-type H+/Na+-transporting ATPase subunit I